MSARLPRGETSGNSPCTAGAIFSVTNPPLNADIHSGLNNGRKGLPVGRGLARMKDAIELEAFNPGRC